MALRFASLSNEQLQQMLTDLVEQIASGVASTSINGITMTYSTPGNIRAAIDEIEAELADRRLAKAKLPRRAALVMQYPSMGGKGY